MEELISKIKLFVEAQQEAEKQGQQEFICPLCGAGAKWVRAPENGHLHCSCGGCGFVMME